MKKIFVPIFACPLIFNAAYSLSLSSVNEHFSDTLTRDNSAENDNLNLIQNSLPHRIKRRYNNNLSNESDSAMQPGERHRDSSVYLDFTNHNAHVEGDSSRAAAAEGKSRNNFHGSHKNTPLSTEKRTVDDGTPQRAKTYGKYRTWITKSEQEQQARSVRSKNAVKRNSTERGLSRKGATHSKVQLTNFEDDMDESGDEDDDFPNTDGDLGDNSIDNLFGDDDDLDSDLADNLFNDEGDNLMNTDDDLGDYSTNNLLNSEEDNLMDDFSDNMLSENGSDGLVDAVLGDLGDGSVDNLFSDEEDSLVYTGSEALDNDVEDNFLSAEDSNSLMDSTQDDIGDSPIDHVFTNDIDVDSDDDLFSIRGNDLRGRNLFIDGNYPSDNSRGSSLGDAAVDSVADKESVLGSIEDDLPLDGPLGVKSKVNPSERSGQEPPNGGKQGSSKDALSKDTVKKDTVKQDTVRKDTVKQDTVKKDTDAIKKDAEKKDTVNKDTVKQDTVKQDTVKKDTVKKDTVKKDTVKQDTVKKDTVKKDTVKQDTVKKDVGKKDGTTKEVAKKDVGKKVASGSAETTKVKEEKQSKQDSKKDIKKESVKGTLDKRDKNKRNEKPTASKNPNNSHSGTNATPNSNPKNDAKERPRVEKEFTPQEKETTSSEDIKQATSTSTETKQAEKVHTKGTPTSAGSTSNNGSRNSGGVQTGKGKNIGAGGKDIPNKANDSKATESNTVKSKDDHKGEGNSTPPVERSGSSGGVTTEEEPPKEQSVLPNPIGGTININIIANPNYEANQTKGKEKKKRHTHAKGRGKKNRHLYKRGNGRNYKVDREQTRRNELSSSTNSGNSEWSEDAREVRSGVDPNVDVHVSNRAGQGGKPTSPEEGAHSRSESPSELSVSIELPHGSSEVKKAEAVMIPERESAQKEKKLNLLQMNAENGDRVDEADEYADEVDGDTQDELILEKVRENKNLERFGEEDTVENIASIEHPLIRKKKNIVKNSRKVYNLNLYNCTFIDDWDLNHEYMDEEGSLVKLSGYVFQNMVNSDLMPTANITDWKLKGSCDYDKYVCGALGYMNNVYSKGERVIFEGRVYEATSDAYGTPREMENVWVEKTDDCYDF
ncbi:hypothetical protein AK88_03495 [Plasmodium fragile]|uniref:Secreted ookinete protein n=1 Tax=Plasmodium fragile TaxID=5857 RepID=A0A0D9QJ94_PLAFR|nr:uncharacterized protein AK88_03495 [Plasmodium fragile]KJP86882.1 hypothetical protein AK88_03495 [Plasmodium fragile]